MLVPVCASPRMRCVSIITFLLFSLSQRSGWGARRHRVCRSRFALGALLRFGGPAIRFLVSVFPSLASRWPRAAHASFVSHFPELLSWHSRGRERLAASSPTSRRCFHGGLGAGSVAQRPAAASDTTHPSMHIPLPFIGIGFPCPSLASVHEFLSPSVSSEIFLVAQRSSEHIYYLQTVLHHSSQSTMS
ncbi:hypothetical protein B0H16DRAFT_521947 [Mycena metata]|uniref:Uncharacterized protein n=1 Tax=Mycena metata TaxID=1033252 RepID=A0AAD7H8M8_9AGAR|nr:hypothetical protein B0H16DRAFT_521947 [Mycena metata]